jgi:hypothetical protein
VFACDGDNEVVGEFGLRACGPQELAELIDELLLDERVTHVEVHDGSCPTRLGG